MHSSLDNEKAKKIINWQPKYKFIEGIEETIKYYKKKNVIGRENILAKIEDFIKKCFVSLKEM